MMLSKEEDWRNNIYDKELGWCIDDPGTFSGVKFYSDQEQINFQDG